jgi:hypothetical protein
VLRKQWCARARVANLRYPLLSSSSNNCAHRTFQQPKRVNILNDRAVAFEAKKRTESSIQLESAHRSQNIDVQVTSRLLS